MVIKHKKWTVCCALIFLSVQLFSSPTNRVGFGEMNGGPPDLSGVDFNSDTTKYNNTSYFSQQNGIAYKDLDLTYAIFAYVNASGASFAGRDLSYMQFMGGSLDGTDFSRTNLPGARIVGANFTKEQLISTADYTDKNLSMEIVGVYQKEGGYGFVNYSQVDFAGVDFNASKFSGIGFRGADFTGSAMANAEWMYSDFRGAIGVDFSSLKNSKNIIAADGVIMSNGATGLAAGAQLIIPKNTHNSTVARLTASGTITTNAYIEKGGILQVESGVNLSISDGATITFAANAHEHGKILLQGFLEIADGAFLNVVLPSDFEAAGYYELVILELDGGTITGDISKDNTSVVHYLSDGTMVEYEGIWDIIVGDKGVKLVFTAIPEPETYATVFGALALAVAAYRRRKQ